MTNWPILRAGYRLVRVDLEMKPAFAWGGGPTSAGRLESGVPHMTSRGVMLFTPPQKKGPPPGIPGVETQFSV